MLVTTLHRAALGGLALMLAGCATTVDTTAALPVEATVSNLTGRTIARIAYQPCGDTSGSWADVEIGTLAAGASGTFRLPAPCVNLTAYYSDGRVAGTQTGVRRDFPFKWTLS